MGKPQWKDATSYSRGDPYPRVPKCWMMQAGLLRLFVSNGHRWFPGRWVGEVSPFHMDPHALDAKTEAEAKAKIIAEAKEILTQALAKLAVAEGGGR